MAEAMTYKDCWGQAETYCGSAKLGLLQHYFCGFDHGGNRVANLEFQFFRAAPGDDAFDLVVADFHDDVSHDVPELKLHDFADQTIASG
jgi:hypothetical protein